MNKQTAIKLITQTFDAPFDEQHFANFVGNLLNKIDRSKAFSYHGRYISDAFKDHVQQYKRLGTYTDPEGTEIDVLIVRLKHATALSRARTMQRNFVARHLHGRDEKDAAIVAYYSDGQADWRFSLVKMEYQIYYHQETDRLGVKKHLTPARRYSFLVGQNEPNHTAQQQLIPILQDIRHNPTLAQLETAFNIESVTKEFFQKYKDLFLDLKDELDRLASHDKSVRVEFERTGIDAANFVKKLLGQIVFLYFLQKKGWLGVALGQSWGNGSKDFLRGMFEKRYVSYDNFFNDMLEPLFYEALAIERHGDLYEHLNCRIPFLNGGLFEPIGNYDWKNIDILLSNDRFHDIFNTFDLFNFTVREDEPLEKEVAVDPEMLGKVFENLLEVTDRKSKGAFYTPREIVHYMCQESLINYLATKLKGDVYHKDIEVLIHQGELGMEHDAAKASGTKSYQYQLPQTIRDNATAIDHALRNIKICDPAIGSGAFPVGLMHEIVKVRTVLTTHLTPPLAPSPPAGRGGSRTPYNFKRHAIQQSIYGVDIDTAAVDIAKLRLWLSLVVDEDSYDDIKPLPNLDYKIVCGNSLLDVEKDLFNRHLFEKIERLKLIYFDATDHTEKLDLKKQIDSLIAQLTDDNNQFDFELYFSEVFHENGGFDVVIGNPPYVRQELIRKMKPALKKRYMIYTGTSDLYTYFYEQGYNLLRQQATLSFITSNKWMRAKYGKKLRTMLKDKTTIIGIIDFAGHQVFEATVDTNVLLFKKNPSAKSHTIQTTIIQPDYESTMLLATYIIKVGFAMPQHALQHTSFVILDEKTLSIKQKVERIGTPLKDWDIKIYRGIITGFNKAFIIDTATKEKLCYENPKSAEVIKPLLRGRDIRRYRVEWADLWLIYIPWHFPLHQDNSIQGVSMKAEKAFEREYSTIYQYLLKYKKRLSARNKAETNIRYEWYALQRFGSNYYEEFEKEKIVWQRVTKEPMFCLAKKSMYISDSMAFFTVPEKNTNFLFGILNSKIIAFYVENMTHKYGNTGYLLSNQYVERLPIPKIPHTEQAPIITLVEKILTAKSADPHADTSAWESEIDRLVYQLYGLTAEEIAIVEGC